MQSKLTPRPKHAQLVLKCFPRLPTNSAVDVRPNSSELAYLSYYCSTRPYKIVKVAAFLEKKTAHDLARRQSTRVLITLHILTALLQHNEIGRTTSFVLIAPSVLRIITEIIANSNDISLIEATTNTWDAFCQLQDVASLSADSVYRALYEHAVHLYGDLAKNNAKKLGKSTQPVAYHDATRLRKVGVTATKSIFVPTDSDRKWNSEFDISLANVFSNLHRDMQRDDEPHTYLEHLVTLSTKNEEEQRAAPAIPRRQSLAATRTFSGLPDEADPDPRAAEGTAQDADRLEEEEVGLLALDCIKAVFQSQNRAEVRGGAVALMRYIPKEEQRYITSSKYRAFYGIEQWAAILFCLIASWTPVQDRFILLVTAGETLARFPLEDTHNFRVATVYAKAILAVLRSDLNLIGLSVIDILLGLINQTVRVASIAGAHPDTINDELSRSKTSSSQKRAATDLIPSLKACISNLARHVYYSDQVTDMISVILIRVKSTQPSAGPLSMPEKHHPTTTAEDTSEDAKASTSDVAPTINPKTSTNNVASSIQRPQTQQRPASLKMGGFSSEDGRQIALEIIKDILEVAKTTQKYSAGSQVMNRNRVPLGVWEGSQWLSQDVSEDVRNAYKQALTTWALYESEEGDEKILDFDSEDCIGKLAEKHKPASVHGSIGQSYRSAHPQLLMLPIFGGDRRMSSGKNSSNGTDEMKPRVKAGHLQDAVHVSRVIPLGFEVGGKEEKPLDVKALLATVKVDHKRREHAMTAPPY